jgi:two-component system LytT family response regulator
MMRVLVADDEAPAREKIERWLGEHADVEVIASAGDGLSAAQCIEQLRPDVAFLDIRMPILSGLQVAAQLEPARAPLIVFVTAYDEYALKAFDLSAIDYLLKPYDHERLTRTVERIRQRLQARETGSPAVAAGRAQASCDRLLVPVGERLQLIETTSIQWLEADDNYVHVHTAARSYLLRRTLQDLLSQLGERHFARVHRSAAVNLAAIESLESLFKGDYEIRLRSGRVLRLSRRYREALFARMGR